MSAVVAIRRDPFARETIVRQTVQTTRSCAWCGGRRRGGKALFQYGIERDGILRSYIGPHWHEGLFCSISCHNTHH
jgi:hypothetical protein